MSSKGNNNTAAIVATAIVAVLAICAAFFAVIKLTEAPAEPAQTTTLAPDVIPTDFEPTEELVNEIKDAASAKLTSNFEVLKLYMTRGLSYEAEPYNNKPEDGYYTVSDSTYTSYAQIEALVKGTFSAEEAERILTDCNGKGAVYKDRSSGKLGISEKFKAADYDLTWENVQFKVTPLSETESAVSVYLHNRETNEEVIKNGTLVKNGDTWLLASLVY